MVISPSHVSIRAVTIQQVGILHISCKMFTIYCCFAIQIWLLTKPVTGRVSIHSASLKTTRLMALDFHNFLYIKKNCQHSIPMIQFQFIQYAQYTAIYCPVQYTDMLKCIELYCIMSSWSLPSITEQQVYPHRLPMQYLLKNQWPDVDQAFFKHSPHTQANCTSNSAILHNNYISLLCDICACVHVKKMVS